ncbi:MAG: hypothetical protein FWC33_03310 [Candidatus Bathyarchaeota archaeon]|nr:hypothetical protein [Candidatus Termiticorpusculum sp.]
MVKIDAICLHCNIAFPLHTDNIWDTTNNVEAKDITKKGLVTCPNCRGKIFVIGVRPDKEEPKTEKVKIEVT